MSNDAESDAGCTASDRQWADLADLILTVSREITVRIAMIDAVETLAQSESNVLRFIDQNPGSTAGTVAHRTGLHRSNLSTALRTLESRGLVERHETEEDGRVVRLYATDRAAANLAVLRREWAAMMMDAAPDPAPDHPLDLAPVLDLLLTLERGLSANRLALTDARRA